MNQGEKYFKVASKELSDLFGEAVRIVPPEEEAKKNAGAGRMADKRRKDAEIAAAGRTESLLHRVRSDPACLLVDPAQPPPLSHNAQSSSDEAVSSASVGNSESATTSHIDTREPFAKFLQNIEENGGLEGDAWKLRVDTALEDKESGHVIKQTFEGLGTHMLYFSICHCQGY